MPLTVRLQKELAGLKSNCIPRFTTVEVNEANMLECFGLILPDKEPYSQGAYKIRLQFPAEYPFKPPIVSFETKIYHPNVAKSGKICLPLIAPENWQPCTKIEQVIKYLIEIVNEPNVEQPLRADAALLLLNDKNGFMEKAKEEAKKFAERRP